ncbi:hypothetical protein BACCAP_00165 [Pseudoflavonifractor capillosus ATCC 29799]|uniref:DUF2752 domain-containing protein n=1 Tax=Pseudoflavonifractor capillosus ATCC 29799 TaxID=411467 RepID=A6NPP9_9FIRM|nr:DUF2752 domain-containing protein [Pseudoflavonifractor capillosus]EDN02131.1 hypothetical protein BACCAP_00165 [Pseudoflavonifractor capillosus ATCC 29799]
MTSEAKHRLKRLLLLAGLILGIGLAYAVFVRLSGLSIPCPFHAVTGLLCPGCGVTRMCLALLRLDFAAAWQANPVLLLLLPVLAALLLRQAVRYVKTGRSTLSRGESALVWGMAAVLLLWGIARNLAPLILS